VSKLTHEVGTLESLFNGFFAQSALPLNVSEAVIDHDYTLLAMKRYGEGARGYWTSTIASLRKMEVNMVEPIRYFLQTDLRSFKVNFALCSIHPVRSWPCSQHRCWMTVTKSFNRRLAVNSNKHRSSSIMSRRVIQPRPGQKKHHLSGRMLSSYMKHAKLISNCQWTSALWPLSSG